jgi:hypothetical protein
MFDAISAMIETRYTFRHSALSLTITIQSNIGRSTRVKKPVGELLLRQSCLISYHSTHPVTRRRGCSM